MLTASVRSNMFKLLVSYNAMSAKQHEENGIGKYRLPIQFWFVLIIVIWNTCPAVSADWVGFRGADKQGICNEVVTPAEWSLEENRNIIWQKEIQGRGHSSPIIKDGRLFLTTAYEKLYNGTYKTVVQWTILILSALMLALMTSMSVGSVMYHRYLRNLLSVYAATIIAICVIWGDSLFDFQDPIRGWIVSSFVFTTAALLSLSVPRSSKWVRMLVAISCFLFSGVVLLAFPNRDHMLRRHISSMVFLLIGAYPFCVGLLIALFSWAKKAQDGELLHASIARRFIEHLAAAILIVVPLFVVGYILLNTWNSQAEEVQRGIDFAPFISGWIPLLLLAITLVSVALVKVYPDRLILRTFFVLSCLFVLLTFTGWFVSQLILHSPYFRYHFGRSEIRFPLNHRFLAFIVSFLFGAVLILVSKLRTAKCGNIAGWFRVITLSVGCLYLVSANYVTHETSLVRAVVCIDCLTGETIWTSDVCAGPPSKAHRDNSEVTPTMLSVGDRVYAYFGKLGLYCLNVEGKVLWSRLEVPFTGLYGVAASPVYCDGKIIIHTKNEREAHLIAFDEFTGDVKWRVPRIKDPQACGVHRTPLVLEIGGIEQLVFCARDAIAGYSIKDGHELWCHEVGSLRGDPVASLASDHSRLYVSDERVTMAFDLNTLANKDKNPIVWEKKIRGANCASPVVWKDILLTVSDSGHVHCLNAITGELLWTDRFKNRFWSSIVVVGNYAYMSNLKGVTTVLDLHDKVPVIVGQNTIGESIYASVAVADSRLYIRGISSLVCVGSNETGILK